MERTPPLSFVVPIGNYHQQIAERAIESVLAQSIYCPVIVVYDLDCRGAGWARNRGLERVQTPFVSFLDSDDCITPDFAEKMLRAYDGQRYVYSDWIAADYVQAPSCPWVRGFWHVITTVIPTAWARYVGGFDEAFAAGEDSDFYTKLTRAGLCGKHLSEALFQYGAGGQRAIRLFEENGKDANPPVFSTVYYSVLDILKERYGDKPMPCCGDNPEISNLPIGSAAPGDVLASALWHGNRMERGRVTGRLYPRASSGKQVWVSPSDIDAAPHLFARVVEMPARVEESDLQSWRQLAGQLRAEFGAGGRDTTQDPAPGYAVPGVVKPDVGRVLRLYQQNVARGAE